MMVVYWHLRTLNGETLWNFSIQPIPPHIKYRTMCGAAIVINVAPQYSKCSTKSFKLARKELRNFVGKIIIRKKLTKVF